MGKNKRKLSPSDPHKTPLGGGKRSRRRQAKLATTARLENKKNDETANIPTANSPKGAGENFPNNQNKMKSAAKRKLNLLQDHLCADANIDENKERCFIELKSLQMLLSSFDCQNCNSTGTLSVSFGTKMGYSREIKITCLVSTHTFNFFFHLV